MTKRPNRNLSDFEKNLYCGLFAVIADGEYVAGGPMSTFDLPAHGEVFRVDLGAGGEPRPATRAEVSALTLFRNR